MFTLYVAAWLSDILVKSSTGTRPSVTAMYDVTRTSAVQLVTTRELPLGCINSTRYNAGHTMKLVLLQILETPLCNTW